MIENKFDRMDYLLETAAPFGDPRDLLEELVKSMSDREFDEHYQHICRNWDIEPDLDKFNEGLALGLDLSK